MSGMSLPPCPDKPNCVSSQAPDPSHRVPPIAVADAAGAIERLAALLEGTPRVSVKSRTADTLHAVFVTRVLRFRDDLHAEIGTHEGRPVLHVRSASRVGHSDLGANRRRVEWLRTAMAESPS